MATLRTIRVEEGEVGINLDNIVRWLYTAPTDDDSALLEIFFVSGEPLVLAGDELTQMLTILRTLEHSQRQSLKAATPQADRSAS